MNERTSSPDTTRANGGMRLQAGETPLSGTEARQGRQGKPVLMVLAIGLVLAMVAWGAAEWWGQATEPPAEQTATPPAGGTTPVNPNAQPSSTP